MSDEKLKTKATRAISDLGLPDGLDSDMTRRPDGSWGRIFSGGPFSAALRLHVFANREGTISVKMLDRTRSYRKILTLGYGDDIADARRQVVRFLQTGSADG